MPMHERGSTSVDVQTKRLRLADDSRAGACPAGAHKGKRVCVDRKDYEGSAKQEQVTKGGASHACVVAGSSPSSACRQLG